jgi:hypothetical protein
MKNFDGLVFRCIDETLAGVMGLVARDAIYLDVLTNFSVTREDLPRHLDSLMAIIESRIGRGPARALSIAIVRKLYSELQMDFVDKPESSLPEYVCEAHTILLKKSSQMEHREVKHIDFHPEDDAKNDDS